VRHTTRPHEGYRALRASEGPLVCVCVCVCVSQKAHRGMLSQKNFSLPEIYLMGLFKGGLFTLKEVHLQDTCIGLEYIHFSFVSSLSLLELAWLNI